MSMNFVVNSQPLDVENVQSISFTLHFILCWLGDLIMGTHNPVRGTTSLGETWSRGSIWLGDLVRGTQFIKGDPLDGIQLEGIR